MWPVTADMQYAVTADLVTFIEESFDKNFFFVQWRLVILVSNLNSVNQTFVEPQWHTQVQNLNYLESYKSLWVVLLWGMSYPIFFLLLVFIYKKCLIEIYFLLEKKVKIYFNSSELRKQVLYTIFITANHAPFYWKKKLLKYQKVSK